MIPTDQHLFHHIFIEKTRQNDSMPGNIAAKMTLKLFEITDIFLLYLSDYHPLKLLPS